MQLRAITTNDIPTWEALSSEYDCYVQELVGDLTEWYDGNDEDSLAFTSYMEDKISKQEAYMLGNATNCCLGIVAFSKYNNRISFLGISHNADFYEAGNILMLHALRCLDTSHDISINEIRSSSEWIEKHRLLYTSLGFVHIRDSLENGVPVNVFLRSPQI